MSLSLNSCARPEFAPASSHLPDQQLKGGRCDAGSDTSVEALAMSVVDYLSLLGGAMMTIKTTLSFTARHRRFLTEESR